MKTRPMRWRRAPLLRFVTGGTLLFVLVHGTTPFARTQYGGSVEPIVLTAGDVARLRDDYVRETGLEPTVADEAALVEKTIEEELIFREALARGLDRDDRSVRNWLVEQMAVLSPERTDDPDHLYARARALGLDRTDLVVRRILVQKMRLLAARVGERPPSDDELRAFYAQHRDEYRAPGRLSFWHVFVSSDERPQADASALLDAIRHRGLAPDAAVRRGDSFAVAPHVVGQSTAQIAKVFGEGFATEIATAGVGSWIGPVRSPYGMHLVWIESHDAGATPALDAVRGRIVERWQQEQRALRVAALLRELKERYPLEVASSAWRDRSRS
jgi:peptidyl-prolyl cis-trans isomerase C